MIETLGGLIRYLRVCSWSGVSTAWYGSALRLGPALPRFGEGAPAGGGLA